MFLFCHSKTLLARKGYAFLLRKAVALFLKEQGAFFLREFGAFLVRKFHLRLDACFLMTFRPSLKLKWWSALLCHTIVVFFVFPRANVVDLHITLHV